MRRRNLPMFPVKKPSLVIKPPPKTGACTHFSQKNHSVSPPMTALLSPRVNTNAKRILPSYPATGEIPFQGPVKPSFVFLNYPTLLTKEEEKEILQFKDIYYIRPQPPPTKNAVRQNSSFFRFTKDDHIAYRYQQQQVIGKGSFGSVLKCLDHKTGEHVAIKMMKNKPKVHSQIMFELDLLKQLQTEEENGYNIIKYVGSFDFRNFFCIVMELAALDLYTVLKNQRFRGFLIPVVQAVARDTAFALKFMHSKKIIHCDIKPENILFATPENKTVKVIDFGCSCYVGKLMFSYIQSRYYRAPEVVFGFEYGTEIDIWSLGCVLCEMITGQPIFPAEDETELMQMIVAVIGPPPKNMVKVAPRAHHYFDENGDIKPQPNSRGQIHTPNSLTVSQVTRIKDPQFLSLIDGCLRWQPKERLTAEGFLNHPWVKQKMNVAEDPPFSSRT
ncbi:CMGC family protein kinase [Tritrichomonas foetus]|uniref:CMGC family protein kinase n=1 Tax=Tritrichomonas foetus TaxID=1144522 RepID=A0A1J4JCW6_9EUKA|nr:CMGC family protein kinase [Tritrichomonas foetus]|eukprot:OHS95116.1 CMGC family protein kinase [Tritrichomonas foetus]